MLVSFAFYIRSQLPYTNSMFSPSENTKYFTHMQIRNLFRMAAPHTDWHATSRVHCAYKIFIINRDKLNISKVD